MTSPTPALDPLRWRILTVLALAQFMVVLDVTIVNVALPDIQADLGFSTTGLQWIVNAYTLAFGGLLLLGGRAADILGRRRLFAGGLALFVGASLVAGVSSSPEMLIVARTVQGIGAALLSPAAFALLQVTFPPGKERNAALGIWGGLAGLGGTLGVIAGGVLVDGLGWEWIFFVNLPIGVVALALTPRLVRESHGSGLRSFDVAGAALSTLGVVSLVYGVIRAGELGWGSTEALGLLVAAVVLLAAFVAVELRTAAPLVPMRLFRSRSLSVSLVALALNGSAFLAMFFLSAIFLQSVRGDSAFEAGIQFVPMGVTAVLAAVIGGNLVTRIGTKPVFIAGSVLSAIGLLLLSRATADGSYLAEIMPGFLIFGAGMSLIGTSNQIAAVLDVPHEDAGAASGVISAGFQIGGAFGLAVITTLSTSATTDALAKGTAQSPALVDGFQYGLVAAAVVALANLVLAVTVAPTAVPDEEEVAEAMVAA
ncbi:MAG: DHA2 family efflux MFS transporter permease subunit [Solirubrobacteraceae bacterium]|nr:DHA2 family efflux MFS transporter permease subunit [Solirubrobacteraceae bacterium]